MSSIELNTRPHHASLTGSACRLDLAPACSPDVHGTSPEEGTCVLRHSCRGDWGCPTGGFCNGYALLPCILQWMRRNRLLFRTQLHGLGVKHDMNYTIKRKLSVLGYLWYKSNCLTGTLILLLPRCSTNIGKQRSNQYSVHMYSVR